MAIEICSVATGVSWLVEIGVSTKWRIGTVAVLKRQPVRSIGEMAARKRRRIDFMEFPLIAFFRSIRRLGCVSGIPPDQKRSDSQCSDPPRSVSDRKVWESQDRSTRIHSGFPI